MKKTILLLLGLMILGGVDFSHAGGYDPFAGTKLEGKSSSEITSHDLREQNFPVLYQIAEEDPSTERAFNAFSALAFSYKWSGLWKKYKNNNIQSEELKQILAEITSAIENPKTDKDYFYKAILANRSTYQKDEYLLPGKIAEYIIKEYEYFLANFPDSIYAEYSLYYQAKKYRDKGDPAKAIELYNEYLTKYGENAKLKPYVYERLASIYINPNGNMIRGYNTKENLAFMLNYTDKFINEYPQYKRMIAELVDKIGGHYEAKGNYDKAIEYYSKVYTDPEQEMFYLTDIVAQARRVYVKKGEIKNAEALLEETLSRYSGNKTFREFYKRDKLKLIQIKEYGYDSEITAERVKAKQITQEEYDANMKNYNKNKDKIEAFTKEYETHFDKDFKEEEH
jgi:predicted negative regulator of RcsB-dependent stress response